MNSPLSIEEEIIPCAQCGTGVTTYWAPNGLISNFNYILVADWIFHGSCWEGKMWDFPND